ncbi:HD domain-containing protein [Microcella indica]|uniref:HD domain-containing protein n=1 Tax=Microcella indica TaxID=2750620 RepID=UPI0032AED71F
MSLGEILARYVQEINSWCDELLGDYIKGLSTRAGRSASGKEFNDPVWGTISLSPAEVVVLDSPLLQRLRRIRQLGVAHYVYPGTNHTRLEHSLGTCQQVSVLTESINRHEDGADFGRIDDDWAKTLRMAGLCHDVGHGLMSHAVENALKHDRDITTLILEFTETIGSDGDPQLSEIAAHYMLLSPAVSELFDQAFRLAGEAVPTDIARRIANCIVGRSDDQSYPLIHEMISGPFDCDKLDYMTRDAMMSGVPVVTDVTRLTQKARVLEVRTDRLPQELMDVLQDSGGTHKIVAIARSGASTLHEVALSRSLMHDKIYRHHKVRAAESMLRAFTDTAKSAISKASTIMPLMIHDDRFLGLTLSDLEVLAAANDAPSAELTVAADIVNRFRTRDLFVRSFAFAQKMPFDAYRDEKQQREGIEELIRDADKLAGRVQLAKQVAGLVADWVSKVEPGLALPSSPDMLHHYIQFDPPKIFTDDSMTDQSRAYIIDDERELVTLGQVSAETRGWADAYINTRDVGFVFAPREIAAFVHLATQVVLRTSRRIMIPERMRSYAKIDNEPIRELHKRLVAAGLYDDYPADLRPVSDFLLTAGAKKRIEDSAKALAGYMGPSRADAAGKVETGIMNPTRIQNWVAQFPEKYQAAALAVVESVLVLDRQRINQTLERFFSENPEFAGAGLVPIGDPKDGSALHTYFAGDAGRRHGSEPAPLHQAVLDDKPIVFIDDIVGRGSSIISIFRSYFGGEDAEGLGEARHPIAPELQERLASGKKIAIVAAAGRRSGLERINVELTSLGMDVTTFTLVSDSDLPRVSQLDGVTELDEFIEYCRLFAIKRVGGV